MDRYSKFTILINRISRSIHRIKDSVMCKYGLKSAHVSCLYYLYKEGKPLTARELCDACEEDKAAVSRAIDLLGKEGYVTCGGNSEKKYKSPITLTQKGEEVGKAVADNITRILSVLDDGVSDGDRAILYESLDKISQTLQDICDN
ncbi:MAG: MarR family transcriptional regulator [Clostridia bacterium]|nr:MarR family transcriptional regulator [Clostridia bacterium]